MASLAFCPSAVCFAYETFQAIYASPLIASEQARGISATQPSDTNAALIHAGTEEGVHNWKLASVSRARLLGGICWGCALQSMIQLP